MKLARVSDLGTGLLYTPGKIAGTQFPLETESEGLSQWEISKNPSGIEPRSSSL